jgi:copper resistance protein C
MYQPKKLTILILSALVSPHLVYAHAALVKSIPGRREVLSTMPSRIELCFSEEIELKFSSIHMTDGKGAPVALGDADSDAGAKCIAAAIKSRADSIGVFTIRYRVLSQDGHVVEYGYQFTVKP